MGVPSTHKLTADEIAITRLTWVQIQPEVQHVLRKKPNPNLGAIGSWWLDGCCGRGSHFSLGVWPLVGSSFSSKWTHMGPAVATHTLNPSTRVTEAGRFLSSRSGWSTEQVPGQPGLHRKKNLIEKQRQNRKKPALVSWTQPHTGTRVEAEEATVGRECTWARRSRYIVRAARIEVGGLGGFLREDRADRRGGVCRIQWVSSRRRRQQSSPWASFEH